MSKFISGLLLLFIGVLAYADDTLVYDPNTGNYTLTYNGNSYVFAPGTNIDPKVQSWFETKRDGTVTYRYRVRNGKGAKQSIDDFRLMTPAALSQDSDITSPQGWESLVVAHLPAVVWDIKDLDNETDSIAPGKSAERFSFVAPYLPQVSAAQLWHFAEMPQFQDEGGEEGPDPASSVGQQFNALLANNYVSRYAAAPAIPIPSPFDPATVLTAIQKHIDHDLISIKLIDPAFAAQFDRLLQAAVDAAKLNNKTAVRGDIKDLRKLLREQHDNLDKEDSGDFGKDRGDKDRDDKTKSPLIDKLAARVLDFDLQYVATHLEGKDRDD